jgi:hypothetical protein
MGAQRTSFGKLQRDRAKKAKAEAKRERRQERVAGPDAETTAPVPATEGGEARELTAAQLLARIELIHRRFDDGLITAEELEEQRADLLARLPID